MGLKTSNIAILGKKAQRLSASSTDSILSKATTLSTRSAVPSLPSIPSTNTASASTDFLPPIPAQFLTSKPKAVKDENTAQIELLGMLLNSVNSQNTDNIQS